ncbi:MAG TPA: autotransporter-associated beta strand repeat-containing protein [Panacibacter sp.]|nr:autotransporter-associated beta strand repeat-containing protein [Panacibacter sp.]
MVPSNAAITPTGLTFTTAGTYAATADITNFKLYQNSSNNLTGATLIGAVTATGTGTTMSISGTGNSIAAAATGYLLLTIDAATIVTVNNTVSITTTALANFNFTSTGAVGKTGPVIPVPASNTQTLIGPYITISAAHPVAGFINQNTSNNIIASFKLDATSGSITPSGVTITTGGTYTATIDITNFKLYQNSNNNLSGATLVGTVTASASGSSISFNSGFNSISSGTTNYLILTADIANTAVDGKTITITSTNFSNFSFTSTAVVTKFGTDPVISPAAPGQTIKAPLITIAGIHPAAGNIIAATSNNILASFSLNAANAAITPTGLSFTTAGSYIATTDVTNFKLYQNTANNLSGSPVLIGTVTATASGTTIVITGSGTSIVAGGTGYLLITADVSSGATLNNTIYTQIISPLSNFTFSSTGSVTITGSGSAGNIQTIKGPQADIGAVHPVTGTINQNSTNNIVASYSVIPSNAAVTPTGITFTTAGTYLATTDITNFKLYQNTSNNLTGATLIGTITANASGTSISITGLGNSIAVGVTNYLIVVVDVASTATNGNTVSITAITPISKFTFSALATVTVTGTAIASNTQTIKSPLVTIGSSHPAAANILAGTNQNIIASFSMVPSNAAATITGITFTSAGTYISGTDISNFKLYQNTTNNLSGGSPTLVGTATATASGTIISISGTGNSVAVGATNYLILTADVAITATNNNTVSIAAITPLSNFSFSSTGTVTVTGSATASNTQTIKTPQVTITAVHPSAGTISQNTNKNIIATFKLDALYNYVIPTDITVTTAGTYIPATDITQFSLYQNNTNNLTTPTLLGSITITGGAPDILTFTTTRGNAIAPGSSQYLLLTVNVPLTGTDGNTVSITTTPIANFGFEGQNGESVTEVGTDPATIGPVKTITGPRVNILQVHPSTGNITQGTNDNQIATYELSVTNLSSGFVNPVSISLTTSGSYVAGDIASFNLWQNSANTLTGATLVGTISSSAYGAGQVLLFNSGFSSIANAGYSYLMLTANVSSTATLTKTVRINANAYTNMSFLSSIGGSVSKLGTDPSPQSNLQTIVGPIAAVSTVHNLAGNIKVGSTDNLLASFQVVVSNADITPDAIKLTTSSGSYTGSSDISNFKLYQNSSNSLTGAVLVNTITASGTSQTLNFTSGFTAIPAATTGFLILVADMAGTATPSRNVSITSTALTNFTFTSCAAVSVTGISSLAASNAQTIVAKLDTYSSGSKNWDNTTANWGQNAGGSYANSVWISNGIAQLEGTAGQLSITSTVKAHTIKSIVNNYKIDASSSSNGITLTSPETINITTGITYTGYTNTNPVIYGTNGFTKTGSGELQIGSDFASTFTGTVYINGGELTLGKKAGGYNALSSLNNNPISINNGSLTLVASSGANASLQNLTSVTCTGNDTIGLYSTSTSSAYLNVAPVTNNSAFSSTNAVPLSISGRLTVDNGGSANTKGDFANATNQNFIAFGSVNYTGDVTFEAYASNASLKKRTGDMININLGGYGHYITGVAVASGTIDDNGYSTTFFGRGGTATDGGEIGFNAAASNMTGDWIIGDAAGTNAAWVVTNTSTCLTRGAITINNYSKLNLQLSTPGNSTITYSPSIINVYGLGPYSTTNSYTFGSALDFYDFARATDTITLPCNVTLNPVYNSKLASIGVMIGDDSTSSSSGSLAAFQLNGTLSGTGGLEKSGPGILILNAQNGSGLVNTYADSTRIIRGTICVNAGSNLGTGPVVMYQIKKNNTVLNFYNTDQTIASLTSLWNDNSGQSQVVTLNGTVLTVNQSASTTFGNGTGTSVGYIAGTGSLVKDGTGTLTLTGANTYTGLTQVKGGVLELKNASGTTLPVDNDVDVIGGTLLASVSQTLNNVTLSSGNLTLADNAILTITGTFTLVPGASNITLGTNAKIVYGSEGTLNYAGNSLQQTSVNAKELPSTNPPKNITFSNYSDAGVKWTTDLTLTGAATVYGWVDMNGKTISGTGSSFALYGLSGKSLIVNSTAGSAVLTNVNTASLAIGMQVTGAGIPANATIIYIDPLVYKTVTLNLPATATGTNSLTFGFRGGLMVSFPLGIDAHIQVAGTKTYKPGASYIFKTPTSGTIISPAFPTSGILNYSPAWDVTIVSGTGSRVIMGTHQDLTISHNLTLTTGVYVSNKNLLTWDNANGGVLTAPNIPFSFNIDSSVVKQSFIALCDETGSPIGDTSGNKGFRINNVGSTEVYFPIGHHFNNTPNRMSLQNFGTIDNFTVTLAKGDIGNTPYPVVRRIWHVKESVAGGSAVTMKLFFIKQDNTKYGVSQDEVESAFDYSDIHLVHKLGSLFQNNANGADVKNYISGYNYGTELYGIYTKGISSDNDHLSNGITSFSPFSIANTHNIILPATIINLKAYQVGTAVKVDWTSLSENNVAYYHLQHSGNAVDFIDIGLLPPTSGSSQEKDYTLPDATPFSGDNYYRIAMEDKDGKIIYSNIALVYISNAKQGITIYPNPVKGKVAILQFANMERGNYSVILYNGSGLKLMQQTIEHQGGSASYQLTLPQFFANGLYHVNVTGKNIKMQKNLLVE